MALQDDQEAVVKRWSDLYTTEVLAYAKPQDATDEEVFADIYHSLAHSSMASTMVQLEHSHAKAALDENEEDLPEYEKACRISNASHARETQRREFRQWIQTIHEATASNSNEDGEPSLEGLGTMSRSDSAFAMSSMSTAARSESFTITLGAQMKAMHNLRLLATDVFSDMCKYNSDEAVALPQRLQTSMALYSNNLSGLVLLTEDSRMTGDTATAKRFGELTNQTTEAHFPSFEQQVESTRTEYLDSAIAWRLDYQAKTKYLQEATGQEMTEPVTDRLKVGDFYVTKHSNMCDVHVVFHMICDDTVINNNINSRHPVIMGLRNVLKVASMNSVTTVTVPLLLSLKMDEQMTIAWCMKRAELVFKCVKGFMMEVASWGGSEIKTLQFLVPKEIDHDVFAKLATMLPSIFRTSNPIRAS